MNKRKCDKCGYNYDEYLDKCPMCFNTTKEEFNMDNPFIKLSKTYKEEKQHKEEIKKEQEVKKEDVLLNNVDIKTMSLQEIADSVKNDKKSSKKDEKLEKQLEIVEKKSTKKKKGSKKQNNNFFSYLLLVQGMILLFIIVLSTIIEFNLPTFSHYVGTVIALLLAFNFTIRGKDFGYYLAIIASVSMIGMLFENDYISSVIGIYLFASSFVYLAKS